MKQIWLRSLLLLVTVFSFAEGAFAQLCPDPLATRKKVASSFHSSVMIDYTGAVRYWGQSADATNGSGDVLAPLTLSGTINGTTFSGTPLAVAAGSRGSGGANHQLYVLTSTGLYGWGHSGSTITAANTNVGLTLMTLPSGVNASDIEFIEASGGGIALVTKITGSTGGEVWIKNGSNSGGAVAEIYGDNTTAIDQNWHRVRTTSGSAGTGTVLTGIARLSFSQRGLMAQTQSNVVYVWGTQVWRGNGSVTASSPYAQTVTLPSGVTPLDIRIISKGYDGNAVYASQFILGTNGKLYAIGEGYHGVLGQDDELDQVNWVTVKGPGTAAELTNVTQMCSNSAYVYASAYYSIGALTSDGNLYLWGDNNYSMLGYPGTSSGDPGLINNFNRPRLPANFNVNGAKIGFFHMGGHTTIAFLAGTNRFCYVGHKIAGSMGDGGSDDRNRTAYDCINTPNDYLCTPPAPLGCSAPSANDLLASSVNGTLVINGQPSVTYWGAGSSSAEAGLNVTDPRVLYEYNGTPRGVAASGVGITPDNTNTQMWILTDQGIWGWGYSAYTITNTAIGPVGLYSLTLPSGVNISDVSFIRSSRGGVALITNSGQIYIKAGTGSACSASVYGDGSTSLDNNWHQVEVGSPGVYLTGVTEMSFGGTAAMAVTPSGVYVWGDNTYLGNNTAMTNRTRATLMTLHGDFTGSVVVKSAEIIQSGSNGAAQFLLGSNGRVYSLGADLNGVLGQGGSGELRSFTQISSIGNVRRLSSNNPYADGFYSIGALTLSGSLYLWGSNTSGILGGGATVSFNTPTIPAGIGAGAVAGFEMGGYQTIVFLKTGNGFYYSGRVLGGSKGDGTANSTITTFALSNINVPNCAGVVYSISGTIYNDANGMNDVGGGLVNGTPMTNGTGTPISGAPTLFVNLLDEGGYVIATTPVGNNGTYSFADFPSGNYTVQVSTTAGTLFSPAPASGLPAGWNFVGGQIGIVPGVGIASPANGRIAVALTATVNNVNVGLDRTPTAVAVTTPSPVVMPVGNTRVQVPGLRGSDPEDQPVTGSLQGKTVKIETLPGNGVLYYNGVAIAAGQSIPNYDSTLLTVDPNDGISTLTFNYSYVDAAGITSAPASATMDFTYVTLSGHVFYDQNGLTNGLIDHNTGGGTGTNLGNTLYVTLVEAATNTILATVPVDANGNYTIDNVPAGGLKLILNTTAAGSITTQLPATWANVGGQIGTVTNVGLQAATGTIAVTVVKDPVSNINFGVEKAPVAYNISQSVPGGSFSTAAPSGFPTIANTRNIVGNNVKLTQGSLRGNDEEDCPIPSVCATGSPFKIQSINAGTTLYYNFGGGTGVQQVTAGTTITNFDPSKLVIYGGVTNSTVGFSYSLIDAAGVESAVATYLITSASPLPLTMLQFSGDLKINKVMLQWTTTREVNTSYFLVQRSNDGAGWTDLGRVPSKASQYDLTNQYDYADQNPQLGNNYYRLIATDLDESRTMSNTVIVKYTTDRPVEVSVAPNPARDGKTSLQFTSPVNGQIMVKLYNTDGNVVYTTTLQGGSAQYDVNLAGVNPGIYFINVVTDNNTHTERIIIK